MGIPIRVLLVDDHPAILDAVGAGIRAADDLELAGTARTPGEARAALESADGSIDVVVSDVQLAGDAEGLKLLVDDHPAILDAVGAGIRAADDLELAGTARTPGEARAALESADGSIDVVVSDVQLAGDAEGLKLLDALPRDGPAVLLLSSYDQPPLIRSAFERGAAGYLIKTSPVTEILDAVRTVAGGGTAFTAAMLRTIRSAPRRPSDREIEVLGLLCAGASNDEIGSGLGVTEKTVESHLRRLFDRYGVLSRTELAVLALREGWVAEKGRG